MSKKAKDKENGIRVKVFVNLNGNTLWCRGRKQFLETVDSEGTIAGAADKLGISYRRAWDLVRKTNEAANFPVIDVKRGGKYGGATCITHRGRKLLEMITRFTAEIEDLASRQTEEFLDEFAGKESVPKVEK